MPGSNAKLRRRLPSAGADFEGSDNEFYTLRADVDAELDPMGNRGFFRGRCIYFPCDSDVSAFWKWGVDRFRAFGFAHIVATSYNANGRGIRLDFDGVSVHRMDLDGNGDFRSSECSAIRDASDVILTNPPFSLLRDFVAWATGKKFAVICPLSCFQYRAIFEGMKAGTYHAGHTRPKRFTRPDGTFQSLTNTRWLVSGFPNIHPARRLPLLPHLDRERAQYHDRNGALEVSKLRDIPADFRGVMGVPPTFLDSPDPRFSIIGLDACPLLHRRKIYARVYIRRRSRIRHLRHRRPVRRNPAKR